MLASNRTSKHLFVGNAFLHIACDVQEELDLLVFHLRVKNEGGIATNNAHQTKPEGFHVIYNFKFLFLGVDSLQEVLGVPIFSDQFQVRELFHHLAEGDLIEV